MSGFKKIAAMVSLGMLIGAGGIVIADSDDYKHDEEYGWNWFGKTRQGISSVEQKRYMEECGSCHFPYQPGLLPPVSWEKVMATLDDHFGENAELDEASINKIRSFLLNNAAGRVNYGLPNKIVAAERGGVAPRRITQTRYFLHEHDEISERLVRDNPEVKSFSNCDSCHTTAKQGLYDEERVRIPGYGRWDD